MGIPVIRMIVYWGLEWGPHNHRNYHFKVYELARKAFRVLGFYGVQTGHKLLTCGVVKVWVVAGSVANKDIGRGL